MSLGGGRGAGDGHGDEGFGEPDGEPGAGRCLARGGDGCGDGGDAHGDSAPAWDGGKFGGAFHGFADIAKGVSGASVDGNGLVAGGAEWAYGRHEENGTEGEPSCQVLCDTKYIHTTGHGSFTTE